MKWRRLGTIPGFCLAWLLWLAATPLWLPVAAISDWARGSRGAAVRSGIFLAHFLSCETIGVVICGVLWAARRTIGIDEQRWHELHYQLEAWWGSTIFRGVEKIYGVRVEIEGEAEAELDRGPYLLLIRHASTADTLLASTLISRRHGLRLRYVLKRELLLDPCLDIVGHRVPNVFVDRSSDDSAVEIARVVSLAADLGPRDGLLIYPEGTRFSEAKLRRVIDRFERLGDDQMLEFTRSLSAVLPPRLGGTLALLESTPTTDVVICAHTGFEETVSLGSIWRGGLVDQRIQVAFFRIAHEEIPAGRNERAAWLLETWRRVDTWVSTHKL